MILGTSCLPACKGSSNFNHGRQFRGTTLVLRVINGSSDEEQVLAVAAVPAKTKQAMAFWWDGFETFFSTCGHQFGRGFSQCLAKKHMATDEEGWNVTSHQPFVCKVGTERKLTAAKRLLNLRSYSPSFYSSIVLDAIL